jgi:hypothetical protein
MIPPTAITILRISITGMIIDQELRPVYFWAGRNRLPISLQGEIILFYAGITQVTRLLVIRAAIPGIHPDDDIAFAVALWADLIQGSRRFGWSRFPPTRLVGIKHIQDGAVIGEKRLSLPCAPCRAKVCLGKNLIQLQTLNWKRSTCSRNPCLHSRQTSYSAGE